MTTRREFLYAATLAGAVAQVPRAFAGKYELLIKGGRVIDPSRSLNRLMDVAISGGQIAAVQSNITAAAADTVIDATGKLVVPGLVDIHAHLSADMPPSHCLSTGVTAIVDGGSRGADNADDLVAMAKAAKNRVRILLNLSRLGLGGRGELLDFANADVAAARRVVEANRDLIIGIKARLSANVAGDRALDAIDRAHEITVPLKLPLMVHIGQTAMPLPQVLAKLRPGDIVTHVYAPPPNSIFDDKQRLLPEVREARTRGIVFDIGNGRTAHITWDMAQRALEQHFPPDTISSDLTAPGMKDRVFDFPTVLSKFLLLGMTIEQVIACATVNAARAIAPFNELGTLRVGAPADVAVFELREGVFEFVDNANAKRVGRQKLFPHAVVAAGTLVQVDGGTKVPPYNATGGGRGFSPAESA